MSKMRRKREELPKEFGVAKGQVNGADLVQFKLDRQDARLWFNKDNSITHLQNNREIERKSHEKMRAENIKLRTLQSKT